MNSKNQRIRRNPQTIKSKGFVNSGIGKTKEFVGETTNQPDIALEGKQQDAKGFVQRKQSTMKEQLQKVSYAVGDGFKRAGVKLQQRGYDRAGRALEKVGTNLEGLAV